MPKPRIDYEAVRRFVLVMMYDAFINDAPMSYDVNRVKKALSVPKNLIEITLDALEEDDFIVEVQAAQQFGAKLARYELTADGRRLVEKMPDEMYDIALGALASGTAAGAFQPSSLPSVGPAPEGWEPLPIELGDPQLIEVRSALARIAELVEGDNGYAAEYPDERAEVLSGFVAASTLFREATQIGYSAFVVYVVWPLEKLLARFPAGTVIGAAAGLLKDALASWVKAKTGGILDDIFKLGK
jgi:hypothetical protein